MLSIFLFSYKNFTLADNFDLICSLSSRKKTKALLTFWEGCKLGLQTNIDNDNRITKEYNK